jgi:hypothetical protein
MRPATHPGREASGKWIREERVQVGSNSLSPPSSAPMDTNLLSNIQKLFSERIDVFSPVEFNKV